MPSKVQNQFRTAHSGQDAAGFGSVGSDGTISQTLTTVVGQSYTLDYVAAPTPGDDHVADKGVDVYIEPKATLFLLGTVMDFEEDMLKSGFTFKNPNQTGECGCGESVMLKPADLKALADARATA